MRVPKSSVFDTLLQIDRNYLYPNIGIQISSKSVIVLLVSRN
jgi:hypothetical protein